MRAHGGNKAAASAAATAATITTAATAAAITATASAALLTIITVRLPRVRHVVVLLRRETLCLLLALSVDSVQDFLRPGFAHFVALGFQRRQVCVTAGLDGATHSGGD